MKQQNLSSQDLRPKNRLGSTLLFIGIFTTATVAGTLILLGLITPFRIRWKIGYWWCAVVGWMTKVFCVSERIFRRMFIMRSLIRKSGIENKESIEATPEFSTDFSR